MIKVALLYLIAVAVIPRLRARSAAERHLLWAATVAIAAVLPVLDSIIPQWQAQWVPHLTVPAALRPFAPWVQANDADIIVRATGLEADWRLSFLSLLWIAGSIVAFLLLIAQFAMLVRIQLASRCVSDPRLLRLAGEAAVKVGLARPPQLLQSDQLTIPIMWGAGWPRIILPTAVDGWSAQRVVAVLAHEMAHVRRHDWTVHILVECVCAIYWFNPFTWIARRYLRHESDHAADDVVVNIGIDGRDYAEHLLDIVRASRRHASLPSLAVVRSSGLSHRVATLVTGRRNRCAVSRRTALTVVGVALCTAVPLASLAAPALARGIQVRTVELPKELRAALSAATAPETAVRNIRVVTPTSPSLRFAAPTVLEYTTPPLYSDAARAGRIEGVVVARARVEADGRLTGARVVRGLGHGLDQNALVAIRQWHFRAGVRDGVSVPIDVEIDVEFSLRQELLNELIANDMATQVGPGVTPPRAVLMVDPPPTRARGRVILDIVLLEDGRPRIVRILRSANPELDELAVRTFESWRFSPAARVGIPVKVRMTAEVKFDG